MGSKKIVGIVVICFLLQCWTPVQAQAAAENYRVEINLPAYTLTLFRDGNPYRQYPVAIGRPGSQTPVGDFAILRKIRNPVWYPPRGGAPVPSGPANPLGYRWLGIREPGYGIHGNSNPASIGQAVSLGCIRLPNQAVEDLFELLPLGTPVSIRYDPIEVIPDPALGGWQLQVYPDVYEKGTVTPAVLREKLAAAGYPGAPEEAELQAWLDEAAVGPVTLSPAIAVEMEGVVLSGEALLYQGYLMLPLRVVAEYLGCPVHWDSVTNSLAVNGYRVNPFYQNGRSYLALEQAEMYLPVRGSWESGWPQVSLVRVAI